MRSVGSPSSLQSIGGFNSSFHGAAELKKLSLPASVELQVLKSKVASQEP